MTTDKNTLDLAWPWLVRADPEDAGVAAGWHDPAKWAAVCLGGLPGGVVWRPGEGPEALTKAEAKAAGWRFRHLGRCRPSALWSPELLARDD